jgi:hypothetical protein
MSLISYFQEPIKAFELEEIASFESEVVRRQ